MIWFLTSFTTFYFQKFVNVLRILNQAYKRESIRSREREPSNSYITFDDEPSVVTFEKEVDVFDDDVDGARNYKRFPLKRKMSFAGGVDGTGQSIAILTSGGDSQGIFIVFSMLFCPCFLFSLFKLNQS